MKNSTAEQYNNRNVIRQMVQIRELAENSTNDVAEAVAKGDAAMVKATEALAKAEAVNQLATDANTNANAALVKADDAKATAQAVDGKAQTALDNSDMAVTDAGDALTTAQEALVQVEGKQDKGDYALRSEIPSTAGLATKEELNAKQDKLTAGSNITIVDNVISATGGSGPSGDYLPLTGGTLTGPLEVPDINLVSDVATQKVMPAKQVFQYINETDDAIARIDTELANKQPVGEYATLAQLGETNTLLADVQKTANAADGKADANSLVIAGKQDKLEAGANITIEGNVISASGGGEVPANVVTTDTIQIITGDKSFHGELVIGKEFTPDTVPDKQAVYGKFVKDYFALKTDLPTNLVTTDTRQSISGVKTFTAGLGCVIDELHGRAPSENDVLNYTYLKYHFANKNYVNSQIDGLTQMVKGKQDKGDYALKSEVPSIEGLATDASVTEGLATKQDKLEAGENITIVGNVISAAGGAAGDYLPLTGGSLTGDLYMRDSDSSYSFWRKDGYLYTSEVQVAGAKNLNKPAPYYHVSELQGGTIAVRTAEQTKEDLGITALAERVTALENIPNAAGVDF